METNSPPLRTSCNRCRAQKLRCVPSSRADACERCLKANVEDLCVFGKRSKTGRNRKNSEIGRPETPQKDRESSIRGLPGLGVFSLSTPSTERADCAMVSSSDSNLFDSLYPDLSLSATSDFLFSMPGLTPTGKPGQSPEFDNGATAVDKFDHMFDLRVDANNIQMPFQPDEMLLSSVGNENKFQDINNSLAYSDRPDPMANLAELLAGIIHYETQLTNMPGVTFENYPIGEALFLSQRFHAVLSECSHRLASQNTESASCCSSSSSTTSSASSSVSSPSLPFEQNLPVMLLALSCYLTLIRVYWSIFENMYGQLSQISDAYFASDGSPTTVGTATACATNPNVLATDMNAYRGLRLSQLQPFNTEWDLARRTKKAVALLLSLLGHVEKALGLPQDVRVVTANSSSATNSLMQMVRIQSSTPPTSSYETTITNGCTPETAAAVFEEGIAVALANGRLYKTVRENARQLRSRLDELDDLLKGLLEI
ncbi:hypothetical protein F5Y14DRAFT_400730 [Nemania sp. NC0429]|nr:hypothetical protein F5Y14DRAFT_400730 [Nemania sp. NC0429]